MTQGETLAAMLLAALVLGCIMMFCHWLSECADKPANAISMVPVVPEQNPAAMEAADNNRPCNHNSTTATRQHQHSMISRGPVTEVVQCWNENGRVTCNTIM